MSFLVKIEADSGNARQTIQGVTSDLAKTEDAADQATAALDKLGTTGTKAGQQLSQGMREAGSTVGATGETFGDFFDRLDRDQARVLQRIKGPWQEYKADLQAAATLAQDGKISTSEYEAELGRLAERLQELQRFNLAPQLRLEADMYEAITGPLQRYERELAALDALLKAEQISLDQYDAALAKVQRRAESTGAIAPSQGPAFNPALAGLASEPVQGPAYNPALAGQGISEELRREKQILDQINGPLREYEAQVKALDALVQKGEIDLETYNRELERAGKLAGRGLGPVQGPKQQTTPEEGSSGYQMSTVQSVVGGAGMLLAGAGVVSLGEQIERLIKNYHDLQDVYIEVTNSAMKFADASHSASLIIDEQIRLAHELHSTERTTIELYDTVRDGTDDLNISHQDQIRLTKTLSEAVQLAGRSMESAGGIVTRLSYAMARGKIEVGDLNRVMRQVPELGDVLVKAFDTDRQGLLAMVREGKVGVEQVIGALVNEGQALDDNFAKRQRTNKQLEEEWILNEKIYSQRYDVSYGAGHAAQAAVEAMKKNPDQLQFALGGSGQMRDLAEAANKQLLDEQKAALQELFRDVERLEGPFQKLGDNYRKMTGDTAAVRAEVTKLNEPIEQAKAEIEVLNKAFEIGKIDVDTYEKEYAKLQTTLNRGISPEAYKLNQPIADAKKSLEDLNGAFARGDVTFDQYRKEYTGLATTIAGHTPVLEKIRQPIEDARVALAELQQQQKSGTITGEAFRREYDALMTTINDGRLPEVIKIWEEVHLPIEQAGRDFAALNSLLRSGRLDIEQYTAELKKISDTHKNADATILADSIAVLDKRLADGTLGLRSHDEAVRKLTEDYATLHRTASGISYRVAPNLAPPSGGLLPNRDMGATGAFGASIVTPELQKIMAQYQSANLVPDASNNAEKLNEQLDKARQLANEFVAPGVKYEETLKEIDLAVRTWGLTEEQATALRRRAKDTLNQETEALEAQKGPMEAYEAALKKLKDQLDAGDISQKQYGDGVDKAKEAMLNATGAADTFSGAMQLAFIKMKGDADKFGASVANLITGDLDKFNEAITTAANGGEVAWGKMVESMLEDLERLALKMVEIQALKALFGTDTGESSGGGDALSAAIGAGSLIGQLSGYATGGSFMVGGNGGIDTTPIAFRATPGERVTIAPPGAYPYPTPGGAGAGAAYMSAPTPIVQIHNHYDSSVAQAAMDSPGGQRSVVNALRLNAAAARSLTSKPRRA